MTLALEQRISDLEEQVRYWRAEATGITEGTDRRRYCDVFGLSPSQAHIVAALHGARGRLIGSNRLLDDLPGWNGDRTPNVLAVQVHRLRKRLGRDFIETVRGVGLRLTNAGINLCDQKMGNSQ